MTSCCRRVRGLATRAALKGSDRVGVYVTGLRRVMGPLKTLYRLFVSGVLRAGRKARISFRERLHAFKIAGNVARVVNPVDRESKQA